MDDRIKKTLDYIEDHLDDTLSLEKLAGIACLSVSQFHRVFKQETQKTPFKFIEEIRMNKAYRMLTNENAFVTKLAMHLGYKDYETFSRAFKKYFHIAPDDLKAITNEVHIAAKDYDKSIVLTFDESLSEEILLEHLEKTMKAHNISLDDVLHSKIFKIERKAATNIREKLIKNKFKMTKADRIWESLLKTDQKPDDE